MDQLKGSKFCLLEFFEDKPVPTIRLGLTEWIEDLNQDDVRANPSAFLGRQVLVRWPDPDKEDQDISTWSRHRAKVMLFGDDTGTLLQLANSNPAAMLSGDVSGGDASGAAGGFELSKETRKFRKRKPEYEETISQLADRPKFPTMRGLNLPPGVAPDAINLMVIYCQHLKKNMRLIRNSLKAVESATEELLQGLSMALGSPVDPASLNAGVDGLDDDEDLDKPLVPRKAAKSMSEEEESEGEAGGGGEVSEESLRKAVDAVESGRMTTNRAAERFGVPRRSISRRLSANALREGSTGGAGGASGGGGGGVFSAQEEEWLMSVLKWVHSCQIPVTREVIRTVIKYYLDKQPEREVTLFSENRPSKRWLAEFMERWAKQLEGLLQDTKMETDKFSLLLQKLDQLPIQQPTAGAQPAAVPKA